MKLTLAPDVGARFDYRGGKFRVNSWLKPARKLGRPKFEWCTREEATHVGGSGIAGCIAPVAEITVTGMVDWPEDQIASARRHALSLVGKPVL